VSTGRVILLWLVLLVLLGLEFVAGARLAIVLAGLMAALVALGFMRLSRSPGLPRAFALAGLFWLLVLFGLTGADVATRHDLALPPGAQAGE
jgi:cytochrome c oxidase subunit 4